MSDDDSTAAEVEIPILTIHPGRVLELAAEIMSLSAADYFALRGRIEAQRAFFEGCLLPEISPRARTEDPDGE